MLKDFLYQISKIHIDLNSQVNVLNKGEKVVNTAIFKKDFFDKFNENIDKYKISFFLKLAETEIKLLKIKLDVEISFENNNLTKEEKNILYSEINAKLTTIAFLKDTFNIEAEKINPHYNYKKKKIDYFHYNKILLGLNKISSSKTLTEEDCKIFPNNIKKSTLEKLISYSTKVNNKISFKFGKYPNFSFNDKYIKITDKEFYNIQNIVSIFFHEVTHFFRHYNGLNHFGYDYTFIDYSSLEEGIALYNEYNYGNQITDYGKYISFYDICFNIMKGEFSEAEKKEKIYSVLRCKGFSKNKSLHYYYRFHRYSSFGGKNYYMKDLIYSYAYKNVSRLIAKDNSNYDIIMSGRIGLNEINKGLYVINKKGESKNYFSQMTQKIKEIL